MGARTPTRSRDVVQLPAEGDAGEDIVGPPQVSAPTVEFHKEQTMEQLNLQATVEVTRYARWRMGGQSNDSSRPDGFFYPIALKYLPLSWYIFHNITSIFTRVVLPSHEYHAF